MIPKVVDDRINRKLQGVYTACTATVTEVNTGTCNIRLEDGEDTELFDVPFVDSLKYLHDHEADDVTVTDTTDTQGTVNTWHVAGKVVRKSLQVGDRVLVVFSKHPVSGVSARRFDINDGVVVAKF